MTKYSIVVLTVMLESFGFTISLISLLSTNKFQRLWFQKEFVFEEFPPYQIRSLSESNRNISLNALLEAQLI